MKGGSEMKVKRLNVDGLAKLTAFCHAVVAGDYIFVSGTVGTKPNSMELVPGGIGPETTQALRNIETILKGCGTTLGQVVKMNVFLKDIKTFSAMNEAYLAVMGNDPPARITVGRADLVFGAAVEIDCIAWKKENS
jgi:2-iminobutanoate/2-iminopropanoate deaminase